MSKIIAIANQKGGVAKTTTAISMGAGLAEMGYKVLLVDVDDSGNPSLSKCLNTTDPKATLTDLMLFRILERDITTELESIIINHQEGMDYIPADNKLPGISDTLNGLKEDGRSKTILREIVDTVRDTYDYIILDAAPALNIMSINVLAAADEIIITTQPAGAADEGIVELLQTATQVKKNINKDLIVKGLLITMLDIRTNYNKNKANMMTDRYTALGMKVFNEKIPRAITAEECIEKKISILKYNSSGKVATAYRSFIKEYLSEDI